MDPITPSSSGEAEDSVLLWMRTRNSYVENVQNLHLRVKNVSKFGENLRGFPDGPGELMEVAWKNLMMLRPSVLEVNHSRNPFSELTNAISSKCDSEKTEEFFSRLKVVSLFMTDIKTEDLLKFLKKLNLLAAFSFSDIQFSSRDWSQVADELSRLNLRALEISDNVLHSLVSQLAVEMLILSGSPGLSPAHLGNFPSALVTVKCLVVQQLDIVDDGDIEKFVSLLDSKFPRLEMLLFDCNVVDPAITMDARSIRIVDKLISLYKSLSMSTITFVTYSPCSETKAACSELARRLSFGGIPGVQLNPFKLGGPAQGEANFTFIYGGMNIETNTLLNRIFVEKPNSSPDIGHLLPLIDQSYSVYPSMVADFGGFHSKLIRSTFQSKKWDQTIQI